MSATKALTLSKLPSRITSWRSAKKRSIRLSHAVGVKCRWNRGCFANHGKSK